MGRRKGLSCFYGARVVYSYRNLGFTLVSFFFLNSSEARKDKLLVRVAGYGVSKRKGKKSPDFSPFSALFGFEEFDDGRLMDFRGTELRSITIDFYIVYSGARVFRTSLSFTRGRFFLEARENQSEKFSDI